MQQASTGPVSTRPASTEPASGSLTLSEFIEGGADMSDLGDQPDVPKHLWGFGGAHGGMMLARMAAAVTTPEPMALRSVTGQFLRPVRNGLSISNEHIHAGKTAQAVSIQATSEQRLAINATAVFGATSHEISPRQPPFEQTEGPDAYDRFLIGGDLASFIQQIEIRPVGERRPYQGGDDAQLTAWIRIANDDTPVDVPRLITLFDALAPSYTAVLTDLLVIPTIELTVRPSANIETTCSPWILLSTQTSRASSDGWVTEDLDAWGPDGQYLGSANQLRIVRQP